MYTGYPQDIHNMEQITKNDKELLTIEEMADVLGVHKNWIYQRTRIGQNAIPHVRLGKFLRFRKEKVLAFLEQTPSL